MSPAHFSGRLEPVDEQLDTRRELGRHHLLPVDLAPVDDECSVTDGVNRALLLALGIVVCSHSLQHDDIVLLDDVDDLAFDIGEALPDQGRPDEPGRHGREPEPSELVGIGAGTGADTDHLVQPVDGGNRNDALAILPQRRVGVIPRTRGDRE